MLGLYYDGIMFYMHNNVDFLIWEGTSSLRGEYILHSEQILSFICWLDLHSFSCVLKELENTGCYFIHVVWFFSGGIQQTVYITGVF